MVVEMRRLPKKKNSNAAVKKEYGVSTEDCPNFALISKIAPLPPSYPYNIPLREGVHPRDVSSAKHEERIALEENDDNSLMGMPFIDWASPRPIEKSPLDSDVSSGDSSPNESATDSNHAKTSLKTGDVANKFNKIDDEPKRVEVTMNQARLSEIDLRYLVHQNRVLLKYAAGQQEEKQRIDLSNVVSFVPAN